MATPSPVARWALAPLVAAVFVAGVWVAGGLLTDSWRAAMALTALWFVIAVIAVVATARTRRDLGVPAAAGLAISAAAVGAFLFWSTVHDRVAHDRLTPGSRESSAPFASGEHATSGRATVVRLTGGRRVLQLAAFDTSSGPDLRVRLEAPGAAAQDIGQLRGNRGDQQYDLPSGAAAAGTRVVVWCRAFSVAFGSAVLRATAGAGADVAERERAGGTAVAAPERSARLPSDQITEREGPWSAFGGDARHSGAANVVGPQNSNVRWRRKLEGAVVPGPVIGADGSVLAASNGGVLHALDPKTGRDRWRFDGGGGYGSDLSTSPLVTKRGDILWPGPSDTLFALDRDGHPRWRRAFDATVLSPARGPGHRVYVSDMGGGLTALDDRTGRVAWRVALGDGGSYASAAVARDGTVYGAAGNDLVAVRDAGGRGVVRWRHRTRGTIEVSPAVARDGTIVIGSNDRIERGVRPDGSERWRYNLGNLTYSSVAITANGMAAFGDHRGGVTVVDARTGRQIVRHVGLPRSAALSDAGVWTAPVLDKRGDVYFGTRPGHIYGFAPDGRRLLDIDTGATVDSNPALGPDGTLYVGSENGMLYAIGRS